MRDRFPAGHRPVIGLALLCVLPPVFAAVGSTAARAATPRPAAPLVSIVGREWRGWLEHGGSRYPVSWSRCEALATPRVFVCAAASGPGGIGIVTARARAFGSRGGVGVSFVVTRRD